MILSDFLPPRYVPERQGTWVSFSSAWGMLNNNLNLKVIWCDTVGWWIYLCGNLYQDPPGGTP